MMKKKVIAGAILGVLVISGIIIFCWCLINKKTLPEKEPCLSDSEVSAAIRYGREQGKRFLVDFQKPWTVALDYSENGGQAVIYPPFHCLALITRNAGSEIMGMDTESLRQLTAREVQLLRFEVTLYGNDLGFDRNYTGMVIKGNEKDQFPVKCVYYHPLKTVSRGYDQAREYTIASRRDFYFASEVLKGKGSLTLRILRPQKDPVDFVFNLDKMP